MKRFHRSSFTIIAAFLLVLDGAAQTPTFKQVLSKYVGPPLPVSGTQAITQVVDSGSDPISDGDGGFYFVSLMQNRVYRVKADGTLLVIAGTAAVGFSGDGGLAIAAELNLPTGIALDGQGNLFIADLGNNRVRKVNRAGIISTVAGTGVQGFGGDNGPAASAQLRWPADIALTSNGDLLIADNVRIRSVSPSGIITTIAGGGSANIVSGNSLTALSVQLGPVTGVTVDLTGNIFLGESDLGRICKVTPAGMIKIVAGNGRSLSFGGELVPASASRLRHPRGISVDAVGNLLVADTENNRIRMVSPDGIITTVAGSANRREDDDPATAEGLSGPRAVRIGSGR
jgi:hypothetical protein